MPNITCKWNGEQVVVDFGTDGTLSLTIPEASALVRQLLSELIRFRGREKTEGQIPDAINVCDVVLTFSETNDLMKRLDHIVYMYELTGQTEPEMDWKRFGF